MPTTITYRSPLLSYFEYSHLPPTLQAISKPFATLAGSINQAIAGELYVYAQRKRAELIASNGGSAAEKASLEEIPSSSFIVIEQLPENLRAAYLQTEAALVKLLEAKDCAVRAGLSIVKAAKECEHTPPISVIVNGQRMSFTKDVISFRELVNSLNMKGDPSVTVKFPSGAGLILPPLGELELQPDTVINVVHTGNA